MREILFRGKRLKDGAWIEGFYCEFANNRSGEQEHFIQTVKSDGRIDTLYHVDPSTVGQYIGRTDKNGAKIFEGDILQYFDDEIQVVEWSDEWSQTMLHTYGQRKRKEGRKTVKERVDGFNYLDDYPLEDMPIIGNAHDNPELLEGGVDHA